MMVRRLLYLSLWSLCLCVSVAVPARGQEAPLWPGAKYDPAIPTIKSVLGHDHGEVITTPDGIAQYLQALQKAAPTRTKLIEYARRDGHSGCSSLAARIGLPGSIR
jgi:hypothetical protein